MLTYHKSKNSQILYAVVLGDWQLDFSEDAFCVKKMDPTLFAV